MSPFPKSKTFKKQFGGVEDFLAGGVRTIRITWKGRKGRRYFTTTVMKYLRSDEEEERVVWFPKESEYSGVPEWIAPFMVAIFDPEKLKKLCGDKIAEVISHGTSISTCVKVDDFEKDFGLSLKPPIQRSK